MSKSFKMDQPPNPEKPVPPRLTEVAHAEVCRHLYAGAYTIDATAGNGHDTLFLARQTGQGGSVHSFDIQPEAIEATRLLLEQSGLSHLATFHSCGHEKMKEALPPNLEVNTAAILFNLGYLPGGDKSITTKVSTTLDALHQSWKSYLSPRGILSILVYPGHAAGQQEAEAVQDWLARLKGAEVREYPSPGPVLYLVTKTCP